MLNDLIARENEVETLKREARRLRLAHAVMHAALTSIASHTNSGLQPEADAMVRVARRTLRDVDGLKLGEAVA